MCAVLEFSVSTYYASKKREREPSARDTRDEELKEQIMRVWDDRRKGRRLYGARKIWLQLGREGTEMARCTVERLMRKLGIAGASAQRKKPRTTVPAGADGGPHRSPGQGKWPSSGTPQDTAQSSPVGPTGSAGPPSGVAASRPDGKTMPAGVTLLRAPVQRLPWLRRVRVRPGPRRAVGR